MAYQSEIEKLERRYQENPDQWFAALADQYRKTGSMELALQVVRAGLEKRPNYVSGHIVLARCLLDEKKDAEAAGVFQRVLELDAENIMALKTLAEIAERGSDLPGAETWLKRLLEVDPMNDEARDALARVATPGAGAPAAEAPAAAAAPPAPDGAISGFEATSFADVASEVETLQIERAGDASAAGSLTVEPAPEAPAPEPAVEAVPTMELEPVTLDAAPGEPEPAAPTLEMPPIQLEEPSALPSPEAAAEASSPATVETAAIPQAPTEEIPPAAPLEGLEPVEFVAPEAVTPEPVQAFDEGLAWGTGERTSREVKQEDVEKALAAHEPSLDSTAHFVPGLEGAELPPDHPDPAAQPATPEETAALPAGTDPEPVVTETMAELYAKQGLKRESRAVYEQLLADRPDDERLRQKLNELDAAPAPAAAPEPQVTEAAPAPPEPRRRLSAAMTGGVSARSYLAGVLSGTADQAPPAAEPAPAPAEASPMEVAFAEESVAETAVAEEPAPAPAPTGAPTVPAADEVSLSSVFGDETPAQPEPEPGPATPPGKGGAFSFDEFFGGQKPPRTTGQQRATPRPDERGDDDFKSWLKGLKT